MRVHFQAPPQLADAGTLSTLFEHTRQQFGMQVHFHALAVRPRVLLDVYKRQGVEGRTHAVVRARDLGF